MTKPFETREQWLVAAIDALETEVFGEHEIKIPPYRVSVGWPGGRGKKAGVIGQCWNTAQTEDGTAAVFVSPVIKDPVEVLRVLVHELIHAVDDCASGHRGAFAKMFRLVGMTGKRTECAAGEELTAKLKLIADGLGAYPHGAIKRQQKGGKGEKTQTTRMLKVLCANEGCGYTLRTTRQWLDVGLPTCACGAEMLEV